MQDMAFCQQADRQLHHLALAQQHAFQVLLELGQEADQGQSQPLPHRPYSAWSLAPVPDWLA